MSAAISAQCVGARVGEIRISAGVKPVLILELADKTGELHIKFFSAGRTAKGNITVGRNSDFAKLFRISTGENPAARFSRADKLLSHFLGLWFDIKSESAINKRDSEYQRVTSIAPRYPIVTDGWTITGHLIKNVRGKPDKKQAIFGQRFVNNQAIIGQLLGNCNSTSDGETTGLEGDFNPISHFPYQIGASHILTNRDISLSGREKPRPISTSPPLVDSETTEPTQHRIH